MLKTRSARLENPHCGHTAALGDALWGLWGVAGPLPPLVCPRCSLSRPRHVRAHPRSSAPLALACACTCLCCPLGLCPPGCAGRVWGHRPRFLPFWLHTRSLGRHGISLRENTEQHVKPETMTPAFSSRGDPVSQSVLYIRIWEWLCASQGS